MTELLIRMPFPYPCPVIAPRRKAPHSWWKRRREIQPGTRPEWRKRLYVRGAEGRLKLFVFQMKRFLEAKHLKQHRVHTVWCAPAAK